MYEKYWSARNDVSLGINEGYYVGTAAVTGYYRAMGQQIADQSRLIQSIFPT